MIQPADTLAVVVGIEEYRAGRQWRLDGPALDACRFAKWLTSRGVPSNKIILLVSPLPENTDAVAMQSGGYSLCVPAKHEIVRDIFSRALPDKSSRLLIIYWGGHGVIEDEERRLLYADATTSNKWNLNLTLLLKAMRSSKFSGHPQQLVLVDACMSLVTDLRWEGNMPSEAFAIGRPEPRRDQRVLLAASPGERAVNLDALKTGLFSQVVRDGFDNLPVDTWPPDADRLRDFVTERFQQLREDRRTEQMPSYIWFRARSGDDTLVFASRRYAGPVNAEAVGGQLLTSTEYRKLRIILDGAPAPRRLSAIYRAATRDVVGQTHPHCLDDLISTLDSLRNPLSPMPLFRFLIQFAADSDASTQNRLWEWINEVAPSWDINMGELLAVDAALRRPFILLRLIPDLLGAGLMVTGWRYEGHDGWQAISSDEPWSRDRLAAEVSRLVNGFDPEDPVTPIIEFQVPLRMMNDALEELLVNIAGKNQEIGTLFPVVVRSLDRLADPHSRDSWQALWNDLTARGDTYDDQLINWVECPPTDRPPEPSALPARVCTALVYPRPRGPQEDPVLLAVIKAGSPVVLWHRTSRMRRTRRAALEEVLHTRGLCSLPDVVLRQRVAARYPGTATDHAGRDLVLLWDDPERVPEELFWSSPITRGVMP